MPVSYGDEWLNVVVLMLSRWGTLPSHLIEDHIKPFLAPTLGVVLALGTDIVARIDAASGGEVWQKRVEPCLSPLPCCLVTAAPNGMMIFLPFMGCGSSSMCSMLNAADGSAIWKRSSWMPGAVFAPTSQLLAGTGGRVLMLRADSGKELWERDDINGSRVEFSPDAKTLAAAVDDTGSIVMLDSMSGEELWRHGPIALVTDFLFSPNSQSLIVSAYTELSSLDVHSGLELWHQEDLDSHSVLMDSDGEHILVGSNDAVVQINIRSGEELERSSLNATGKCPKAVSVKTVSTESAVATRSNQLIVLDKKTWSISNIFPVGCDELVTASGNHLAAVLQEKRVQYLAMLTSTGELLWKWKGSCADRCVRSMSFVVPPKAISNHPQSQHNETDVLSTSQIWHQPQPRKEPVLASASAHWKLEEVREGDKSVKELPTSKPLTSGFSQDDSVAHAPEPYVLAQPDKGPAAAATNDEFEFFKVVFLGLALIALIYLSPHRLILPVRAIILLLLIVSGCTHGSAQLSQFFGARPLSLLAC